MASQLETMLSYQPIQIAVVQPPFIKGFPAKEMNLKK
jgi:hypothetical protein